MSYPEGTYQGYANRSTFSILLYADNERELYDAVKAWIGPKKLSRVNPTTCKMFFERQKFLQQLTASELNWFEVDWQEIADEFNHRIETSNT